MGKASTVRLNKELLSIEKNPIENILVRPMENNLLKWYFIILGPKNTPYEGGEYLGVILFEKNYPFAPPHFKVFTPTGRFKPGDKICMSMTGFHKESWNPMWTISSMLVGLVSYMTGDETGTGTMNTSKEYKVAKAKESWTWNRDFNLFIENYPERVNIEYAKIDLLQNTVEEELDGGLFATKLIRVLIFIAIPILLAILYY